MKILLLLQNPKVLANISKYLDCSRYDVAYLSSDSFISNGKCILLSEDEIDIEKLEYDYIIYSGSNFDYLSEIVKHTRYQFCLVLPYKSDIDYNLIYSLHNNYHNSISLMPKKWLDSGELAVVRHLSRINLVSWRILLIDSFDSIDESINYIEENYL